MGALKIVRIMTKVYDLSVGAVPAWPPWLVQNVGRRSVLYLQHPAPVGARGFAII